MFSSSPSLWVVIVCITMSFFVCCAQTNKLDKSETEIFNNAKLVAAVISWSGGMVEAKTEQSIWKISTHPSVEGFTKIDVSATHRARNVAIESVLQQADRLQLESNTTITHILLISQNVEFEVEDLNALLLAQKDLISGLSLTKLPPYRPSFIPLKSKQFSHCDQSPAHYFQLHSFNKNAENAIIEVEAMNYDFALIKLSALRKAKRLFAQRGEWFYTSSNDDFFGSINCYPTFQCKSSSPSIISDWEKMMSRQMEEEDFCFGRQMKKFGFKLFVHSSVHISRVISSSISYHPPSQKLPSPSIDDSPSPSSPSIDDSSDTQIQPVNDDLFEVILEEGEAVVVENRITEVKERKRELSVNSQSVKRNNNMLTSSLGVQIVVATPIWSSLSSTTTSKLQTLAQTMHIIGRVSITHESITVARNKLLRLVENEFENYTHVLFVDSDMTFTATDLERLIYLNKDISFGLAVRRGSKHANLPAYLPLSGNYTDFQPMLKALGLVGPSSAIPVQAGGMAFTLIKRSVIEDLKFITKSGESEWFWTEHFVDPETQQEFHLSEDYTFCKRAREAGHEIFLETAVQLGHYDTKIYTIKDFLSAYNIPYAPVGNKSPEVKNSKDII